MKRLLALRTSYVVRTMSQCEAHLRTSEEGLRVPDQSVLMWDLWVDESMANLTEAPGKEDGSDAHKKYVVLEGYMVGETEFTEGITAGLRAAKGYQCKLDAVYDELMAGLKRGLKEVTCGKQKGQVYFTKDLANMRKELHRRELKWLRSKGGDDQKQMRSEYLEMRLIYSKAVRGEKRSQQRRMWDWLEQELKCPKKFWKSMKQWGGCGCVPLATAVLCMEFPQTTSSGSHEWCRGRLLNKRRWRQDSLYIITCM